MLVDDITLSIIVSTYLVANTPNYLYQRLRQIPSVQSLATRIECQDMIGEFQKLTSKKPSSVEDISLAYAILAAITFLDYRKAIELFDVLDLSKLEWGRDFRDIYVKSSRIINFFNLQARLSTRQDIITTDSSTNTLLLKQLHNDRSET